MCAVYVPDALLHLLHVPTALLRPPHLVSRPDAPNRFPHRPSSLLQTSCLPDDGTLRAHRRAVRRPAGLPAPPAFSPLPFCVWSLALRPSPSRGATADTLPSA